MKWRQKGGLLRAEPQGWPPLWGSPTVRERGGRHSGQAGRCLQEPEARVLRGSFRNRL